MRRLRRNDGGNPTSLAAVGEDVPNPQKRKATAVDQQPYINFPYLDYILLTGHGQALLRALVESVDSAQKKQKLDSLSADEAYELPCSISPDAEENAGVTKLVYNPANHIIDITESNFTTPRSHPSRSGSCSSVSSWSVDVEDEQLTETSASSRSSSRSRRQKQNKPSSATPPTVVYEGYDKIWGVVFNQLSSNQTNTDPASLGDPPSPKPCARLALANETNLTDCHEGVTYRNMRKTHSSTGNHHEDNHENETYGRSSGTFNGTGQPVVSPTANFELLVEDGRSSESPTSSASSMAVNAGDTAPKIIYRDELEAFIKNDVLRSDLEVAELFYEAVRGKLEYAKPEDIEQPPGNTELSLLHLLELEAFGLVEQTGAFTTQAPSSSSGASSSSSSSNTAQGIVQSFPSASQNGGPSNSSFQDTGSPDEGPTQQTKPQKSMSKSGISQSAKAFAFRCFHNALSPEIFCVNQDTREKFRACMGPGWSSMQHLREHMQTHHTKQVKKLNPLQCSICQEEFLSQEDLRSHTDEVECPIRCPECNEVFDTKPSRMEHRKLTHIEEEIEVCFMELDEKMWKKVKDELKSFNAYLSSLKKGKGTPRVELEEWIKANTARYEAGRSSKAKANSRAELGQWYTIYTALASQKKILDHPFYDYATIPHSDIAEEKILFVYNSMVNSRILAHGAPPSDLDSQLAWHHDALRDSLRAAAKLKKAITYVQPQPSPTPTNMSLSAPRPRMDSLQPPQDFGHYGNMSVSASPNALSDVVISPESYLVNAQSVGPMDSDPNLLGVGVCMNDSSWYTQGGVHQSNAHYDLDARYIDFGENIQDRFGPTDSSMMGNTPFPGPQQWSGQGRQQ